MLERTLLKDVKIKTKEKYNILETNLMKKIGSRIFGDTLGRFSGRLDHDAREYVCILVAAGIQPRISNISQGTGHFSPLGVMLLVFFFFLFDDVEGFFLLSIYFFFNRRN